MEVIVEAIGNRLRGWLDAMLLFRRKRLRRSTSRGRWTLARYRAEGVAGLRDRSCAAHPMPPSIDKHRSADSSSSLNNGRRNHS